jgi:tetratricopeptide (TPR) repeat protein
MQTETPDLFLQLAEKAYAEKDYASAEYYLKQALVFYPRSAELHCNLGLVMQSMQKLDEACQYFTKAMQLDPALAHAHYNLGNALREKKELDAAIVSYQNAIRYDPECIEAYNNLGLVFFGKGQFDEAIAMYQKALQKTEKNADIYFNLGNALKEVKQYEQAIQCYRRAIELKPDFSEAYNNTGLVFQAKGELQEASQNYRKALDIAPGYAMAYYNLGTVFAKQQEINQAISCYEKALELNPDSAELLINLGVMFHDYHRLNEAVMSYRRAIELDSGDAKAHWCLANSLLLSGNFDEGWQEYEWRFKIKEFSQWKFSRPRWDGSPLQNSTILLYAEQGLGDTIQFIRYAPLVAQKGARVILECQRELISLLSGIDGVEEVVERGRILPDYDLQCSLLSLPLLFSTTIDMIPGIMPYLHANPQVILRWEETIHNDPSGLKVGLVWSGNPVYPEDRIRSCPVEFLLSLGKAKDTVFYSLQKGEAGKQAERLRDELEIIDYTEQLHDFSDTAALIENLDLVISVDTSVAHLAGALGKQVWTLLPFSPDWRWMLNREDTPWYPSMRLFRQKSPGDWKSVINRIIEALLQLDKSKTTAIDHHG